MKMISPNQILASANLLATTEGGTIDESIDRLNVSGQFDAPLLEQWCAIASDIQSAGLGSLKALDSIGDEVDLTSAPLEDLRGNIRILIEKPNSGSTLYAYSDRGLSALLGDTERFALARSICIAELHDSFRTASCTFSQWTGAPPEQENKAIEAALISPRKIVKDVTGGKVPGSIEPYLLVAAPSATSKPYDIWRTSAYQQLLLCLANELWRANGEDMVVLTGPRIRQIPAGLFSCSANVLFDVATECARWVYASGQDVEVRHTLFTYELAREWPDTETFSHGFAAKAPRALDSAKTAFHAHVRKTSNDTLKALGDLRKTLSDEVAKVIQQTRELLSVMWRDFALAVTALVARSALLVSDKQLGSPHTIKVLIFGTAIFLAFSLYMTLRSNAHFMAIAAENRKSWRDKLYGFLPKDDLKKLADDPLRRSESEYKATEQWVISAYAVMIFLICSSAFWDNRDQPTSDSSKRMQPAAQALGSSPSNPHP
ncbi:hypothetical protein [Rhodoferax antarcticus]|uniref:hypothetical protein n=1 Tax=Rhodoferax antarcticus TaxID=81479 RepID=UPI0022240775|nr:hypothetical protein [Rhodoferax antarcticus]MCW2313721.1 hypothetical protein [Rhodoferax antarcticus]